MELLPLFAAGISAAGSLFGSSQNTAAQEQIAQQNIAAQKDYAQHGLSWRVEDAKSAGINPLAALNFQGPSYSNVVGATNPGAGVAAAGQDIGRAIQSMRSPEERQAATQKTILDMEGMQLDNDLKRTAIASSIRKMNQPGTPPGIPPLMQPFKNPDGSISYWPSKEASAPVQATGPAGSVEFFGRRAGSSNPTGSFKGQNRTGFTPWDPFGWR